ncbi:MAG TPA: hemerythrin domain-containing protein [Oleiagrimonas sp.]|nr:hemerythrin domain-containing protein [Oleiagrimonas sp.]
MGFFRRFIQHRVHDDIRVISQPSTHGNSTIRYDNTLLDTLHDHHARLGVTFARIRTEFDQGHAAETRKLLTQFKSSLQAHVMTENVRFYTYITQLTESDPETRRTMFDFRRDMNRISRQVIEFVKKWQSSAFDSVNERQQFAADYDMIKELLAQRFDSEEDHLYPMYVPA